jgi:uncharacterized protein YydD (DUF2326 family)
MYLNNLVVYSNEVETEIRNIKFKKDLNLIVDSGKEQKSGNDIGKTTFLRAIDFCFGSDLKELYYDRDEKKENSEIKDFLINNQIVFTLNIGLVFGTTDYILKRWFTGKRDKNDKPDIRQSINDGEELGIRTYTKTLNEIIFKASTKPSFRDLIPKFIREDKDSMGSLLRFLANNKSDEEYNSIHLLLFGFSNNEIFEKKAILTTAIKNDKNKQTVYNTDFGKKNKLEAEIKVKKSELEKIELKCNEIKKQISSISNLETDINELSKIVLEINQITNSMSEHEYHIENIKKSIERLSNEKVNVDLEAIKLLYKEINLYNEKLHKDFTEVKKFHNEMIENKINFSQKTLLKKEKKLNNFIEERKKLISKYEITKIDTDNKLFEELNEFDEKRLEISNQLKIKENVFEKLSSLKTTIENNEFELVQIVDIIKKAEEIIKENINIFNKYFSDYTKRLYNDEYFIYLKESIAEPFEISNKLNPGDGKKKAFITAFDLAYAAFIKEKSFASFPRFIAEDQMELIDTPQLEELFNISKEVDCQLIIPVLNSKISAMKNLKECEILTLSDNNKFFKF